MKKLVITALTLLTCGAAYALPVGNPSEASLFRNGLWCDSSSCCDPCDPCFSWCEAWSFRLGFYGDYVFNRNLQIEKRGTDAGNIIRDTEIYTNAAYLALNFCNRVDIFATLGATEIQLKTNSDSFAILSASQDVLLFTETDFSWSIGARASLWSCGCFTLGIEGQYFRTSPDLSAFIGLGDGAINHFNDGNGSTYEEGQVGVGISYAITTMCPNIALVPYAAVKWSTVRFDTDDFQFLYNTVIEFLGPFTIFEMEESKNWGFAIGTTLTICDAIGVTVEGRWADEKAVYVNGQFRF